MTHRSLGSENIPPLSRKLSQMVWKFGEVIMGIVLWTCCQVSLQEER